MDPYEFDKKIKSKNENLFVIINDKISSSKLKFSISNESTLQRAKSLLTKEPVTIKWIRGFKKNATFFDVGANVGMYSIFAAIIPKVYVYSFEPESNNFQTLMANIVFNNLIERINPYPIGLSNVTSLTTLYLNSFKAGGAHHTIGESLDHNLQQRKAMFKQGIFSTTIDALINEWKLPVPNYLKIDVDGIEHKIIERSKNLLKNKVLQSILIEINSNREKDKEILEIFKDNDFIYDKDQVNKSTRKTGSHAGYAEYLFYRK